MSPFFRHLFIGAEMKTTSEIMKPDHQSIIEEENGSDPSSTLTLKFSNENCGGSDLTVDRTVEGISSRSSSSLDNFGSAFRFDAGLNTTEISQGIANNHVPQDFLTSLIPGPHKIMNKLHGQINSSAICDRKSEGNVGRPRGSTIAIDTKSSPPPSFHHGSEKDEEMGEWLELGLGSINNASKCPPTQQNDANPKSVSFTEDCSRPNKVWNRAGFSPRSKEADLLNTPIQQFVHDHSTQIDCHFPYGIIQSGYDRGKVSTISSSSSHQSYLDRNRLFCSPGTKFSAQHNHPGRQFHERNGTQHQNSEKPAVLQNVRERIHHLGQWSCNRDFARTKSINFGEFVGPRITDISAGRTLVSIGLTNRTRYRTPQCTQSLFTCESKKKQTSADQFSGMQPCTATILQSENAKIAQPKRLKAGVWFMLQVAATMDGDQLLPEIPKTYLRIKDETITILLVKKYLASKLGLKSESEIEITCKGRAVMPFLTLQYVRDQIWFSSMKKDGDGRRSSAKILSEYLMILNYERRPSQQKCAFLDST